MDKKTTTTIGIAIGAASLLAGAGYGIYKYLSSKRGNIVENGLLPTGGDGVGNAISGDFIGNSLVKSNSLYGGAGWESSGLVGGGLYKSRLGGESSAGG